MKREEEEGEKEDQEMEKHEEEVGGCRIGRRKRE